MQEQDAIYLKRILGDEDVSPAVQKSYEKVRALADRAGMQGPLNNAMLVMVVHTAKDEPEAPVKMVANPNALKAGDKVIVKFKGKDTEGVFLHQAGGIEKGKVRVAIVGDKEKYREVPVKAVKRA